MLKKRQREVQASSSVQNFRPIPQPNFQSSPLENPEIFELNNIILLLQSQYTENKTTSQLIQKQLLNYISKHKIDPRKSQLIYYFLKRNNLFIKSLFSKLLFSFPQLEQMVEDQPNKEAISQILINYLNKNSIYEKQYCKLVRKVLFENYFIYEQVKINNIFVKLLVYLLKNDPNKKDLASVINLNLSKYLTSNQHNIPIFFSQILKLSEFHPSIQNFISTLLRKTIHLQPSFEKYLLQNFVSILSSFPSINHQQAFEFLCYKMKSLDRQTRKYAITTIKQFPITAKMVSIMIQKDVLEKTGIERRGILLQMIEDQYKDIRIAAIDCLKKFLLFMNTAQVKQILLYMINDQSDQVRAEALKALTVVAKSYVVNRSDLDIILMPLKEKSRLLRHLCYKVLQMLTIQDQNLFVGFVTKLLKPQINYKEDKIFLYRVMRKLGNNYPKFVSENILQFLGVSHLEVVSEPSWKNFIHKARVILIANAFAPNYTQGIEKNKHKLPTYFLRHYQYIKDVQSYAFQQDMLPLEILPLFSNIENERYISCIRVIQSHKMFWQQLPINPSTVKQRFFYSLLVIAQSLFNIQNVLQSSQSQGIFFAGKVVEIFQTIGQINGRFQKWTMQAVDKVSLVLLQYYIFGKLSPLQFNKTEVSKLSILNCKVLYSYIQKYGESDFVNGLQKLNKLIMTNLEEPRKFAKQLRTKLIQNSIFQSFFNQLKQIDKITLVETLFTIQSQTISTPLFKQYNLECQITNSQSKINDFKLKVMTNKNQKILRILESDSKEKEMEEEHKQLYSIELQSSQFQGESVKEIQALKRAKILGFVEQEIESQLEQLLKMQTIYIVLDSVKF